MAVNISNTKHFKKGDKLPDGTTAKRGVVWNTKTNKRVTGKVLMSSAGQGAMGATKSYKAGRAVKPKSAASKPATSSVRSGGGSAKPTGGSDAAENARQRRLEQNKGVKGGTIRAGAAGRGVRKYNAKTGRWERVTGVSGATSVSSQSKKPSVSRSSDESNRMSRRPGATTTQGKAGATSGYVRGVGSMGASQTKVRADQLKKQYGAKTLRGALSAKAAEDRKNQGRNMLGIATATIGPALLATPAGAAAAGAAGRAAAGAAGKVARPIIGGTSKSGKSTSNKASIAAFKVQRKIASARAAAAKARADRAKNKGK